MPDYSRLYGAGFNALFTGDAPTTSAPFQNAGRTKGQPLFDQQHVNNSLMNHDGSLTQFDPRTLVKTQPMVTRGGVQHYMNNESLFNDANSAGNKHPVVYTSNTGTGATQHILLSGHHRATKALLAGHPLDAIHITDPSYVDNSIKTAKFFVRTADAWGPDEEPLEDDDAWTNMKNKLEQNAGPTRQQLQQQAHMNLKQQGYSGNFEQASRRAFIDHVDQHYTHAENATNGYMLNPLGKRKGIDPKTLFHGNPAIGNASDELRAHWNENGRPEYSSFREGLISGTGSGGNNSSRDWTRQNVAKVSPFFVRTAANPVDWNHARNLYHQQSKLDFNQMQSGDPSDIEHKENFGGNVWDYNKLQDHAATNPLLDNATDHDEWQEHSDTQNHYLSHLAAGPWQEAFTTARGVRRSAWDLMGKTPNKTYTADPHIQHNEYNRASDGQGVHDQVNQDNAHMAYAFMHGIHNAPVDNETHLYRMAQHPNADQFVAGLRTGNTFNMPMASFASHEPSEHFGSDLKFHVLPGHKSVKGANMGYTQDYENPMEDMHEHITGGKFKIAGINKEMNWDTGDTTHTIHLQHVGTIDPDPLVNKKMAQNNTQMTANHDPNEIDISAWDELFDGPHSPAHKEHVLKKNNEKAKQQNNVTPINSAPSKRHAFYIRTAAPILRNLGTPLDEDTSHAPAHPDYNFKFTPHNPQTANPSHVPVDVVNAYHKSNDTWPVGTLKLQHADNGDNAPRGLINWVSVDPDHKGKNLGASMLQHAVQNGQTPIHDDWSDENAVSESGAEFIDRNRAYPMLKKQYTLGSKKAFFVRTAAPKKKPIDPANIPANYDLQFPDETEGNCVHCKEPIQFDADFSTWNSKNNQAPGCGGNWDAERTPHHPNSIPDMWNPNDPRHPKKEIVQPEPVAKKDSAPWEGTGMSMMEWVRNKNRTAFFVRNAAQWNYDGPDQLSFSLDKTEPTHAYPGYDRVQAHVNGQFAGHMIMAPQRVTPYSEHGPGEIADLLVSPQHRGKGIAREMAYHAQENDLWPKHSDTRTPDGDAFAKATPELGFTRKRSSFDPDLDEECYEVVQHPKWQQMGLTPDAGFYKNMDHAWLTDPKGNIVDPTAKQFGKVNGPQNDPENYTSYTLHHDKAQAIAHSKGWHEGSEADPEVCAQCASKTASKRSFFVRSAAPITNKDRK